MNIRKILNSLPKHTINLSNLNTAYEITHYGYAHKIEKFLYSFRSPYDLLKHGQSTECNEHIRGVYLDRLYRQAAHAPGWPTIAHSNSGEEFGILLATHFPDLTRHDLSLDIYDLTHYKFLDPSNISGEVKNLESAMIQEYIQVYGYKPKGNIQCQ